MHTYVSHFIVYTQERLNYAELDNLTGPGRFGSVEHDVPYAQVAETQH